MNPRIKTLLIVSAAVFALAVVSYAVSFAWYATFSDAAKLSLLQQGRVAAPFVLQYCAAGFAVVGSAGVVGALFLNAKQRVPVS